MVSHSFQPLFPTWRSLGLLRGLEECLGEALGQAAHGQRPHLPLRPLEGQSLIGAPEPTASAAAELRGGDGHTRRAGL